MDLRTLMGINPSLFNSPQFNQNPVNLSSGGGGMDMWDIGGSKPVSFGQSGSSPMLTDDALLRHLLGDDLMKLLKLLTGDKSTGASPTGGTSAGTVPGSVPAGSFARNLQEGAVNTQPQFQPILRGDEAAKDAKIRDQASFGRAVDEVAREYGLDPNVFRAQLEVESGAFSRGYKGAMGHEGDVDRGSNSSIGMGQISRNFLDGGAWSHGGPNDPRVGGKTVTTEQYMNSPTIQLRVAAANLAMRIQDHGNGDLTKGLLYYVSGSTTPNGQNTTYLEKIEKILQMPEYMNIGR